MSISETLQLMIKRYKKGNTHLNFIYMSDVKLNCGDKKRKWSILEILFCIQIWYEVKNKTSVLCLHCFSLSVNKLMGEQTPGRKNISLPFVHFKHVITARMQGNTRLNLVMQFPWQLESQAGWRWWEEKSNWGKTQQRRANLFPLKSSIKATTLSLLLKKSLMHNVTMQLANKKKFTKNEHA